jgi:hypothetical protein
MPTPGRRGRREGHGNAPSPANAVVTFSATSVSLSAVEAGEPVSVSIGISRTSGGQVSSYGVGTIVLSTGSGWCTAAYETLSGGQRALKITIDQTGLATGAYTATVPIQLGNSTPGSQDITVNLTVTPAQPGLLVATAKYLSSDVTAGSNPTNVSVVVQCIGGNSTLAGPSISAGSYNPAGTWCTRTATANGDGTYTITLSGATSALGAGNYRHAFGVTDANTTNTVEVIWDLAISAAASVALNAAPSSLSFTGVADGTNPASQTVVLTNTAPTAGDLAGPTVTEGTGSAWLSASVPAGGGDTYTSNVSINLTGLAAGSYSDTLRYTDTNAVAASVPQIVAVSLTVQSATLPQRSTTATLHRFLVGGPSSVRGWCGVPLPPGWLNPGDTSLFRIRDSTGAEIPIYVEALGGTHADGSMKAIYVEFDRTLAEATPETVTVECGVTRNTTTDLSRSKASGYWDGLAITDNTSIWKTGTFPDAIINFPKTYLSTTQFWGPYDLRYDGMPNGPTWQTTYFNKWKQASDTWWNLWTDYVVTGGVVSYAISQYDRAAHQFALWATTGDAEHYRRGCASIVEWRNRYARKFTPASPGSGIAVWESCPWGLAFHYWLTGDNTSRTNLSNLAYTQTTPSLVTASLDDYESEPRPLAFNLYGLCAAKACAATPAAGTWDTRITAWLDKWLPSAAAHPGWITSGVNTGAYWNKIMYNCATLTSSSELTQNFMLGLLVTAIDQYLTYGDGTHSTEAETRMAGLCDFLLTQDGTNANGRYTVKYNNQSLGCGQQGATFFDQVNLNGIYAGAFGVASRRLGTATYTTAARSLLETTTFSPNTGNDGPYIFNSARTCNETFHRAWEALAKVF